MKCKKIEGLLITDYLDKEIDGLDKVLIEQHLACCPVCRDFAANTKRLLSEPFTDIERSDAPEFIWRRVKDAIISERERRRNPVVDFFERLKGAIYIPKPALVFISIITLLLIVGIVAKLQFASKYALKNNVQEQVEYLDYPRENSDAGFGTLVEQYFL